jgi:hypothetical protein
MVLNRRGTYSICQPFWKRFSKKTAGNRGAEHDEKRILLIFDWLPLASVFSKSAADHAAAKRNEPQSGTIPQMKGPLGVVGAPELCS